MASSSSTSVILEYVCPTLGAIMASIMFAAPVRDLRKALIHGALGDLNPFPFSFMTGNCLGWTVYGYYQRDPFVVAANLPGLILSIWLNSGASKLQYLQAVSDSRKGTRRRTGRGPVLFQDEGNMEGAWDASPQRGMEDNVNDYDDIIAAATASGTNGSGMLQLLSDTERRQLADSLVTVPQERALLRVLTIWTIVLVYVGWFAPNHSDPAAMVGLVVNINLIVFYGAPLQAMHTVIATRNSASIHVPTMIMNWLNTSFWMAYGFARHDYIIIVPNAMGLCLGVAQGVLRVCYPSRRSSSDDSLQHSMLVATTDDDEHQPDHLTGHFSTSVPEEERPTGGTANH